METHIALSPAEHLDLARRLLEDRQLSVTIAAFDAAEATGADSDTCSAGRWTAAMLEGNFEAAWRESDAIRARGAHDQHRFWSGEDVRGKRVIVRCLHGFGDAIQFLRYLPRLRSLASEVTLEVPPRMLELAPMLDSAGTVITWGDQAPAWDVQVEVMELPYLFRTRLAELPIATRYLRVHEEDVTRAAVAMGASASGLRVGLVWASGQWDASRSLPVRCVERLLQTSGVEFWSLQGGAAATQAQPWMRAGAVRDAAVCGAGQRALSAVIANLDLVLTVDTLAAHLAGAIGKPAWVLLQHAADWRWMTRRSDTPWYPSMRLFRQPSTGNWEAVATTVQTEMSRLVDALASRRLEP